MGLSAIGYVKREPAQIKEELVKRLKLKYPGFVELPADIQNNLLDTAIEPIMQHEQVAISYLNAIASDNLNDFIFEQFAESVGLRIKNEFKAQAVLTFKGNPGLIIPEGTKVETEGGAVFITDSVKIIPKEGEVTVLAVSENKETFAANTITKLISVISNSKVEVTNKEASLSYIPAETNAELKLRAQAKLRAAKRGSFAYANSLIKSVYNINSKLVNFRVTNFKAIEGDQQVLVNGVEAVVGGGDDYQVAELLYRSFFETQRLVSNPSNNETNRTVSLNLLLYGQVIPISFTRPKSLRIKLKTVISVLGQNFSEQNLLALFKEPVVNYVNNLGVGVTIRGTELEALVLELLKNNGIEIRSVKSLEFLYALAGGAESFKKFNSDNTIAEMFFDTYLEVTDYGVQIA